jgi:hypothetical protein
MPEITSSALAGSAVSAAVPNAIGWWTRHAHDVGICGFNLTDLDETDLGV